MRDASIQEYIRAIGISNNINVNVDPGIDVRLTNNFKNVTAKEVFLFLCKRYDLDILFVGPILNFTKYVPPVASSPQLTILSKAIQVKYDSTSNLLSYNLSQDTLAAVTRQITKVSGKNIVYAQDLA